MAHSSNNLVPKPFDEFSSILFPLSWTFKMMVLGLFCSRETTTSLALPCLGCGNKKPHHCGCPEGEEYVLHFKLCQQSLNFSTKKDYL